MLFIRYQKQLPDTLLKAIASKDDYRYELYAELKEMNKLHLFPAVFNRHTDIARSELMSIGSSYRKPDTLVYLQRLPVEHHGKKGYVYFFKYRVKKEDLGWKIAMAGIVSEKEDQYFMDETDKDDVRVYSFSELTNTRLDEDEPVEGQLWKQLKREMYSKRKSAANFYYGEDRGEPSSIRFRD
jgi:hypothetical protein